jgi:hypothetical protein
MGAHIWCDWDKWKVLGKLRRTHLGDAGECGSFNIFTYLSLYN